MEALSRDIMRTIARMTYTAEQHNTEIAPITDTYPDLTLRQAYEIQVMREVLMTDDGYRVIGGKMGLTSKEKMRQMGIDQSTYGRLFDYMLLVENEDLELDSCIHPRIESEIAFVMGAELMGPYVTSAEVMHATEYISPAFEVIDSRYKDFKFRLCDGVVDNISAKRFKLGGVKISPKELDMVTIGVTISVNDEDQIFGASGAVLGHPARAVAAYANLLHETGRCIRPGDIILSGAITPAISVRKGDLVKSEFLGMGSISLQVI